MVLAILLMLLGAAIVVAGLQWRSGQWVESGRWVTRRISPHAVVGTPAVGIMVFSLGLMLIWPIAVLLAFGAAIAWIWVMAKSAETGARGRLPRELIEQSGEEGTPEAGPPQSIQGPAARPPRAGPRPRPRSRQPHRTERSTDETSARTARPRQMPQERDERGRRQAISRRAG
jgi:hypothetical protein